MLLSLASVLKGMQTVRGLEARHWLLADCQQRDASGDLTGAFRHLRTLSDGIDAVLVLLFACGWYWFHQSGAGGTLTQWQSCDLALRGWMWWALVLKLIAPIAMSLAIKAWFVLWLESPAAPGQPEAAMSPASVSIKKGQ